MPVGRAPFPCCPCTSGDACHTPATVRLHAEKPDVRFAPECVVVFLSRRCGRVVLDVPEMHAHR